APSAGIPSDLMPYYDIGLLGVLSDGSIVVACISRTAQENISSGVLFAWKPDDAAWRQLAPPLTAEVGALTPFASPSTPAGADTLYLVMVNRSGFQGTGVRPTPESGASPTAAPGTVPTFTVLRYDP